MDLTTRTLDAVVRTFRWDAIHDYKRHEKKDGKIVALYGLGLYECDLDHIRRLMPMLQVTELRRVEHDDGAWLRVDLKEAP